MVRRNGAEAKKERMRQIAQYIQAKLRREKMILLSKTIAELEYEYGLTKERVSEYLETLENLGQFTIDKKLDKITKAPNKVVSKDVEGSSDNSK
jgi:hypothetical protein